MSAAEPARAPSCSASTSSPSSCSAVGGRRAGSCAGARFAVAAARGLGHARSPSPSRPRRSSGAPSPRSSPSSSTPAVRRKDTFSALAPGSAVRRALTEGRSIEHLILCGVETPICVFQTAVDALQAGTRRHGLSPTASGPGARPTPAPAWTPSPARAPTCCPRRPFSTPSLAGASHPFFRDLHRARQKTWLIPSPLTSVRDLKAADAASGRAFASLLVLRKVGGEDRLQRQPVPRRRARRPERLLQLHRVLRQPRFRGREGRPARAPSSASRASRDLPGPLLAEARPKAAVVPPGGADVARGARQPRRDRARGRRSASGRSSKASSRAISHPELRATVRNVMDEVGDAVPHGARRRPHDAPRLPPRAPRAHRAHGAGRAGRSCRSTPRSTPTSRWPGSSCTTWARPTEYEGDARHEAGTPRHPPGPRRPRLPARPQGRAQGQARPRAHRAPGAHHPQPPGQARVGRGRPGRDARGGLRLHGRQPGRQDGDGAAGAPKRAAEATNSPRGSSASTTPLLLQASCPGAP